MQIVGEADNSAPRKPVPRECDSQSRAAKFRAQYRLAQLCGHRSRCVFQKMNLSAARCFRSGNSTKSSEAPTRCKRSPVTQPSHFPARHYRPWVRSDGDTHRAQRYPPYSVSRRRISPVCAREFIATKTNPKMIRAIQSWFVKACIAWITADNGVAHRATLRVRACKSCCPRATLPSPNDLAESLLPQA